MDGITDSTDMNLSKLQEMVKDRGGLACCSPQGRKESDTTWWLNNNDSGYLAVPGLGCSLWDPVS